MPPKTAKLKVVKQVPCFDHPSALQSDRVTPVCSPRAKGVAHLVSFFVRCTVSERVIIVTLTLPAQCHYDKSLWRTDRKNNVKQNMT